MNQSLDYNDLLQALLKRQQTLNEFVVQLDENVQLFGLTNIPVAQDSLWECHFQRLVSWLYILYWEIGKKADLQYLIDLFPNYKLDPTGLNKDHPKLIRSLRTIAQHNVVSQNNEIGLHTQNACQEWFNSACGLPNPNEDGHWQQCLHRLFNESEKFFDTLHQCLLGISKDESCDEMIQQWRLRREKKFAPWDYDDLIREVMSDLGIGGQKQVVLIRERYQNEWDRYLKSLTLPNDFRKNIKRKILDTLLEKTEVLMPLDADDIIQNFQIEAGDPKIRKLLAEARDLFRNNPYLTKTELIDHLRIFLIDFN